MCRNNTHTPLSAARMQKEPNRIRHARDAPHTERRSSQQQSVVSPLAPSSARRCTPLTASHHTPRPMKPREPAHPTGRPERRARRLVSSSCFWTLPCRGIGCLTPGRGVGGSHPMAKRFVGYTFWGPTHACQNHGPRAPTRRTGNGGALAFCMCALRPSLADERCRRGEATTTTMGCRRRISHIKRGARQATDPNFWLAGLR